MMLRYSQLDCIVQNPETVHPASLFYRWWDLISLLHLKQISWPTPVTIIISSQGRGYQNHSRMVWTLKVKWTTILPRFMLNGIILRQVLKDHPEIVLELAFITKQQEKKCPKIEKTKEWNTSFTTNSVTKQWSKRA